MRSTTTVFCLAVLLSATLVAQEKTPSSQAAGARVEGVVTRAGSDYPVARARVRLVPITKTVHPNADPLLEIIESMFDPYQGVAASRFRGQVFPKDSSAPATGEFEWLSGLSASAVGASFTTGADGHFVFTSIPPGQYGLLVVADGYSGVGYRMERSDGRIDPALTLQAAETVTDLTVRLTPTGSIEGRVLEMNGEPVAGMPVYLCTYAYRPGGKLEVSEIVGNVLTDDRGAYRIFWVSPGRYLLAAGGRSWNANSHAPARRPLTFLGGTADPATATPIDIRPGSEQTFDWSLPPRHAFRIVARVTDSSTGRPPVDFSADDIDVEVVTPFDNANQADEEIQYDPESGRVEISNLVAGVYTIKIAGYDAERRRAIVHTVRVADADILGIVLDAAEMREDAFRPVKGRIRISGRGKIESFEDLKIRFDPQEGYADWLDSDLKPDGTFTIPVSRDPDDSKTVAVGSAYRVSVEGLPPGWYVTEARIGSADVLNAPAVIQEASTLEITLSAQAAEVAGVVVDADARPAVSVTVNLIPRYNQERQNLYQETNTDQKGVFKLQNVPPGDYAICTLMPEIGTERLNDVFFRPDVLERIDRICTPVTLKESKTENLRLTLTPIPEDAAK